MLKRPILVVVALFGVVAGIFTIARADPGPLLLAGAAKEDVTPFTVDAPGVTDVYPRSDAQASNPDGLPCLAACREDPQQRWSHFEGTVTSSGVWGEPFTDVNGNGRYDAGAGTGGEPFSDDPANAALDADSAGKWDGIYLAGFGPDRVALGAHDKLWARVAVFASAEPGADLTEDPSDSVAIASVDFLGYFGDWTDRIMEQARSIWMASPQGTGPDTTFFLDRLILSHTNNHQGPDVHVGMWGPNVRTDGTYPLYERYVERKIALGIVHAMQAAVRQANAGSSTKIRAGAIRGNEEFTTARRNIERLAGMQARTGCRTPWFFDDELRAVEAVDAETGTPIFSMINWGAQNESLGGGFALLSSDFAGYARDELESRLGGGVAMWMPGAQGAVEIVGEACAGHWARNRFDGETFPSAGGKVPLGPARTRAIGRLVGDAAYAALRAGVLDDDPELGAVEARDLYVHVTNQRLAALALAGIIDKPGYAGNRTSTPAAVRGVTDNNADGPTVPSPGIDAHTTLYAFQIGPASFVTVPGELFPELYYGVETYNRTDSIAYDERPLRAYLNCSAEARMQGGAGADHRGRPWEPPIREHQVSRYETASVHFVLGSTPDLLGGVIPGYDYSIYGAPVASGAGVPLGPGDGGTKTQEAPDDCAGFPIDDSGARYPVHREEAESASSMLGPAVVCTLDDLLHPEVNWGATNAACAEWERWKQAGLHNPGAHATVPSGDPERDRIRHY